MTDPLIEALLLMDNILRDEDLTIAAEEVWLGVVDRLIDMGVDIDASTKEILEERRKTAERSSHFILGCVNYRLKTRSLWQRIFGPHELDSKMSSVIRQHLEEDVLGVY